jgi:guanylate kinase
MMKEHHLMHKLYCLMGPSGTGKSALATSLKIPYAKFHITRPPRKEEKDGVHSYFISNEEFNKMTHWVCHTEFDGNQYGLHEGELQPLWFSPMTCITDVNNFLQLKEYFINQYGYSEKNIVGIYIDTPRELLIERMALQKRGEEAIKSRIMKFPEEEGRREYCKYSVMNHDNFRDSLLSVYETIIQDTFSI